MHVLRSKQHPKRHGKSQKCEVKPSPRAINTRRICWTKTRLEIFNQRLVFIWQRFYKYLWNYQQVSWGKRAEAAANARLLFRYAGHGHAWKLANEAGHVAPFIFLCFEMLCNAIESSRNGKIIICRFSDLLGCCASQNISLCEHCTSSCWTFLLVVVMPFLLPIHSRSVSFPVCTCVMYVSFVQISNGDL